ncbi:AraC family transcriptional regulator [Photobacterium alginatilyticum]|uniref:AraC family transcriptional regulator n=1 Tax=Photobacterium alginatilyticum TaxID=1775171 RepID=A0ABW9YGJ4_9GAMM|nr:AraC family transcriptional regulator [Photobacterium alginatilyticum]NBI52691.1 AraC family transcriptional regulator [Photobacterium alginatilyticum]
MENSANMDALADVLKAVRLSANTYFCTDFNAPWGMEIEESKQGVFHVVVEGACWLKLAKADEPIQLDTGDIVAFPTGGAHWISDTPNSPKLPGSNVVENILNGNNPFQLKEEEAHSSNTLLCGSFRYDSSMDHPFVKDLPCFIHISASESPENNWLKSLVTVLAAESRQSSPGSTVMVDRLTEVLFIQLMRAYIKSAPNNMGYIAALADHQIGSALNLIHSESKAYWSVERLSEAVALSRTAFTLKFSKMVGMPPKTYLINWRMQRAKAQLETSNMPMINVAENAGYSSEAAFSKAFKLFFEQPPGQVRRNA